MQADKKKGNKLVNIVAKVFFVLTVFLVAILVEYVQRAIFDSISLSSIKNLQENT
jgi:hypothetical protein